MFEIISKSLKIPENKDDRKLFILYFGENEKQPSYGLFEPLEGLSSQKSTFFKVKQFSVESRKIVRIESSLFYGVRTYGDNHMVSDATFGDSYFWLQRVLVTRTSGDRIVGDRQIRWSQAIWTSKENNQVS